MALQTSGPISLNDMHVEVGGTSGTLCSVNDADIRELISRGANTSQNFQEYYGKAAETSLPTGGSTINGQAQLKRITASSYISSGGTLRVPSNMWVWSDSASHAALTIDIPCTVINDGKIIGCGGKGGSPVHTEPSNRTISGTALDAGAAINVTSSGVTITNSSGAYIAGGGGGGGSRTPTHASGMWQSGAGAGGGGAGGGVGGKGGAFTSSVSNTQIITGGSNAAGGALNATGSNGSYERAYTGPQASYALKGSGGGAGGGGGGNANQSYYGDAGAGGRILPGSGGSGGNAGGNGFNVNGAAGGSGNNGGGNGGYDYHDSQPTMGGGGGGGWGASGGYSMNTYGSGGLGGAAITGTSRTLSNSGTIYGST